MGRVASLRYQGTHQVDLCVLNHNKCFFVDLVVVALLTVALVIIDLVIVDMVIVDLVIIELVELCCYVNFGFGSC